MSRESYQETQIPTAIESTQYADHTTIARGLMRHAGNIFMGTVTGAGGVGDTLEEVPFEPGIVIVMNPAGATPAIHFSAFGAAADHITVAAAAAANGTPPVLTGSDNDWDVAVPVGMLPNSEVATVICLGFAKVGGSE